MSILAQDLKWNSVQIKAISERDKVAVISTNEGLFTLKEGERLSNLITLVHISKNKLVFESSSEVIWLEIDFYSKERKIKSFFKSGDKK